MILPKGSLDLSRQGGEKAAEEVIDRIKRTKLTGYILVLGTFEDRDGKKADITGQLVFREGVPVLCEAVLSQSPLKGRQGVYPILKTMTGHINTIEVRSKIDVGPPLAFFKECKVLESDVDLKEFKARFQADEEEKRRKEEEIRKREEMKRKVRTEAEKWIASGIRLSSFPKIMERDYDSIQDWFEGVSRTIERGRSLSSWAQGIEEVDLEGRKKALLEALKVPEEPQLMERAREEMEVQLTEIREKRKEMQKWVDLWKEEGYNTKKMEEGLKADIQTAWNNLTQFMDDIQKLKDSREQLEALSKMDTGKGFSKELTDIEFLMNDPLELSNIQESLEKLKAKMEEERSAKEKLLSEASDLKREGFDILPLKEMANLRIEKFKVEHTQFVNNAYRIQLIRQELSSMDRRDIPKEIDSLKLRMTRPLELEEYETALSDLKKKIDALRAERDSIKKEIEQLKQEGYNVAEVERSLEQPIEKLRSALSGMKEKVKELKALSLEVSDMDHRWLEKEFSELTSWLYDPGKVQQIRKRMKELSEAIEKREKSRLRIKGEMGAWKKEGFKVDKLEGAIEGSIEALTSIYDDIAGRIGESRELLKGLLQMDARFFPEPASEVRSLLMDPYRLDDARTSLVSLRTEVEKDRKVRDAFTVRIKDLSKAGWNTAGLDRMLKAPPTDIGHLMGEVDAKVARLQEALDDVDRWDPIEVKLHSKKVDELKTGLRRIEGSEKALDLYEELKDVISGNKQKRDTIRQQLAKWKEGGFIIQAAHEKLDSDIGLLVKAFDDLKVKVERLESLQKVFDRLDIKHFASEAENLEIKLNDPYVVEDLEKALNALKEKIDKDRRRRQQYGETIKNYVSQGFMGARKLIKVMGEDISIVELEFKNFEKEVQNFKKLLETTGYVFLPAKKGASAPDPAFEKDQKELHESLDNLMADLSREEGPSKEKKAS